MYRFVTLIMTTVLPIALSLLFIGLLPYRQVNDKLFLQLVLSSASVFKVTLSRPGHCPEIPEILKFVLKCPEIGVRS